VRYVVSSQRKISRRSVAGDISIPARVHRDRRSYIILIASEVGGVYQLAGGVDFRHEGIRTRKRKLGTLACRRVVLALKRAWSGRQVGRFDIPSDVDRSRPVHGRGRGRDVGLWQECESADRASPQNRRQQNSKQSKH